MRAAGTRPAGLWAGVAHRGPLSDRHPWVVGGVPRSRRVRSSGARSWRRYRARMQKWEYASVPLLVHATKQILDNWGQDGWELVTVIPGPNPEQLVAYLKRPLQ